MKKLTSSLLLSGLLALSISAPAAQVAKVKGKSILIDTEGEDLREGDVFFVIDISGEKKAIVKIMKVRGTKAIARVGKGAPQVGMSLERRGQSQSPAPQQQAAAPAPRQQRSSLFTPTGPTERRWGGLLGMGFDTLNADEKDANGVKTGSTVSTTGMSFSLLGLYDHKLFNNIWFRGLFGAEQFKTSGTASSGSRSVDITYLSAGAIGRYVFANSQFQPWAGGGFVLLFPLSKSSNLLDSASITNTYSILFTGGLDWKISERMYVPLSLEYGLLPKSDSVEANWIQLRGGLAIPF